MLTPADQALLERDPDVSGLRLILDAEALSAWLSERMGTSCRVQVRRVRYKHATSCVAALRVEYADAIGQHDIAAIAKAYSTEAAVKIEKSGWRAPEDAVLAIDQELGVAVTTLAGDRDVRALRKLATPEDLRALLERLLPDHADVPHHRLSTLRHNPERRWVGLLEPDGREPIVLRAYRENLPRRRANPYLLLEGGAPRTPALLGASRRHAVAAVSWIGGTELARSMTDPAGFSAAGAVLAELHSRTPVRLHPITAQSQAEAVIAAGQQIATLAPALADEAEELARSLAFVLAQSPDGTSVLHGDFSADQVVRGDDGSIALIDLDSAGLGDPAIDLGCMWAAALSQPDVRVGPSTAESAIHALCTGYETVRPLPAPTHLAAHTAAHILRRAAEPFRDREPGWAERMTALLGHAREHADRAGRVGGRA